MELKDTLNLPQTTLAMRANAPIREVEIQKFWDEIQVYEKSAAQREKSKSFILHDGPPYLSSDKIHIGTALNKILKDILLKYKSQKGFYAPYVPGYDAHGMPIENAVVKKLKGGRESVTPYELRQLCRDFAMKNLKGQEDNFRRLGCWGDWEHPYNTIDPSFEAQQIRIFGEIYKKGYVQKGLKPVYWCADCETALAEAEVEYGDHISHAIYVRFEFEDPREIYSKAGITSDLPLYTIIWTTTPWTIPSNMAVCMHPKFDYEILQYENANYVIAKDLVDSFCKEVEWQETVSIGSLTGMELESYNTKHPLYDRFSPIILGEHVTTEAGTGAVHTAPGHGLEDWEVGQKYGIETFSPLNDKGVWTHEVPDLAGTPYYKGNAMIIEKLEGKKALISKGTVEHSYPHCWRCKKPVMYRATPQWFVRVGDYKEQTLKAISEVKWIPANGERRISNMVENRSDWCISRQRAWGVPIPVFYCKSCGEAILNDDTIDHVAKVFEKQSSDAWVKLDTKDLLPEGFKCSCGSCDITREKDIMDVWFDSGVSWSAVVDARKDELLGTPVDMYLEGTDQYRGWFQSSLLTCVAINGTAPYKSVLTHGFIMAGDGRKMSKSLGNFVTPQDITKDYGADILRLWAASVDYRNDAKIGETIIKQLVEIFKKTRNTARFLLGNLFDFEPEKDYAAYDELKPIDKFALHRLNVLVKNVDESFENYEFYKYFQYLQNFAAVELSSFYLDIVKDRLYTSGKKSLSRRACQTVLHEMLQTIVRILVPVMPHQAEDIWQNTPECQRQGLKSILLSDWVEVHPQWENNELECEFSELLKVREIVTRAIEPLRSSENKTVGSSLEVGVYIKVGENADTKAGSGSILKKYENDLKDIFITSSAELVSEKPQGVVSSLSEDGYEVYITLAKGEKCERCWKYRELSAEGICPECADAIKE